MQFGELIERQADSFIGRDDDENRDGLYYYPGIISADLKLDRFDLITPEGERLRLNPRLNRASLSQLRGQTVRALLRASPWPLLRPDDIAPLRPSSKTTYDVLFVEALDQALEEVHATPALN